MNRPRLRSVRSKLIVIVLVATMGGILLAAAGLLYVDLRNFQKTHADQLETEARILADASVAALDFDDPTLAGQSLRLLTADPRVVAAVLYRADGEPFARYQRKGSKAPALPDRAQPAGVTVHEGWIDVAQPVLGAEHELGSLFIRASYGREERWMSSLGTFGLALLLGLAVSAGIAVQLRRWITRPVKLVTDTARQVIEQRDFSLRASKVSDDEIGYLVDAFNAMLSEIASRTEAIESSRALLEREVEERRLVQRSLERSELRHRTLVTALSSVVWRANASGGFIAADNGWRDFTGQSDEAVTGLGWRSAIHADDHGRVDRAWAVAIHDKAQFEVEARLWHAQSSAYREVLIRGVPMAGDSPEQLEWMGVIIDIGDRRAAEREVLALNADLERRVEQRTRELEAANRALEERTHDAEVANRSKAEFLANMSHEIRTPMNAVLGMAYLLERQPLDEDNLGLVRKIRAAGHSLQTIINDILDFSKIEAGRLEIERAPFSLNQVLDSLSSIMAANAGNKDIELIISPLPSGCTRLLGDALRLEQVLINLTGNAIKFTHRGIVSVAVSLSKREGETVDLMFVVSDTGIGIPAHKIDKVFSAFAQGDSSTTRRFGGTGLGLAICRHLVEQMGGEIGVRSTEGRGSEFWFRLPFVRIAEQALAPAELDGLDVLIVDDCDEARHSLVGSARSLGWRAATAASGGAGLQAIIDRHRRHREFDVVVLDWRMPEMDGLQTARLIRERSEVGDCPIVIMATEYSREELTQSGAENLVDSFLSKPVTPSSLYNAVAQALRRKGRHSAEPIARESRGERIRGIRALVVDDSDINREVASRILRQDGAEVVTAENGRAAVDWLRSHPGKVDIVLMDVQMPEMDGYEATRMIRSTPALCRLPVVALTAGAFKSQIDAAHEAGMDDFVAKPFDVDTLMRVLQRLTGGGQQVAVGADERLQPTEADADVAIEADTDVEVEAEVGRTPWPVLDRARALEMWGSEVAWLDYLRQFGESYRDAVANVRAGLELGDGKGVVDFVHKLQGAAGNLALVELNQASVELERSLREGGVVDSKLAAFTQAVDRALQEIVRQSASRSAEAEPAHAKTEDERSEGMHDLLAALRSALIVGQPDRIAAALDAMRQGPDDGAYAGIFAAIERFDLARTIAEIDAAMDRDEPRARSSAA